jgi:hypothetical protein
LCISLCHRNLFVHKRTDKPFTFLSPQWHRCGLSDNYECASPSRASCFRNAEQCAENEIWFVTTALIMKPNVRCGPCLLMMLIMYFGGHFFKCKNKKVKLFLCLTKHHVMKTHPLLN